MLRERAVGESLWGAVLPAELRELPPELGKLDEILDDERFLAPFRSRLSARIGCLWGAKTEFARREFVELQVRREIWHPQWEGGAELGLCRVDAQPARRASEADVSLSAATAAS